MLRKAYSLILRDRLSREDLANFVPTRANSAVCMSANAQRWWSKRLRSVDIASTGP